MNVFPRVLSYINHPESDDMLKISIFKRFTLSGIKFFKFALGSKSEDTFKILIIGDGFCEILFSVNINSEKIFPSRTFARVMVFVFLFSVNFRESLFVMNLLLFSNNCSNRSENSMSLFISPISQLGNFNSSIFFPPGGGGGGG